MAKLGITAKVETEFVNWRDIGGEGEPLIMAKEGTGLHSGLKLKGTVTLEQEELYDILKAVREDGKEPLCVLRIVDKYGED